MKIAPSLLAADLGRLAEEAAAARSGGAEWLHVDVMDGEFVPNLTMGVPTVEALRNLGPGHLDVHLMVNRPERFVGAFAEAGADTISLHVEATPHAHRALGAVREAGKGAGAAINPGTPLTALDPVLEGSDLVVVMSVNPGFGGQSFIPSSIGRVERLAQTRDRRGLSFLIEVDGGVVAANAGALAAAGADVLVSGSGVFGGGDPAAAVREIRRSAAE